VYHHQLWVKKRGKSNPEWGFPQSKKKKACPTRGGGPRAKQPERRTGKRGEGGCQEGRRKTNFAGKRCRTREGKAHIRAVTGKRGKIPLKKKRSAKIADNLWKGKNTWLISKGA